MTKKPKPVAVLEIKWADGYFRSTLGAGVDLNKDQADFVQQFWTVVNAVLKNHGIKAPEIGIINQPPHGTDKA